MEGVKDNNVGVSEIGNVAELIRQRKHSKQKQRTSVVVSSELVAMDAIFVPWRGQNYHRKATRRSATTAPFSYSDVTTFKSSDGVYIFGGFYTPSPSRVYNPYAHNAR